MAQQQTQQIEIVVADAGPLISLARVDALDLLLIFKDSVRLVITDFVEFEVTRNRDAHPDAKIICDFISRYAGIVEIQETSIGKTMKQLVQMREMFDTNPQFRQMMINNKTEPPQVPKDIGELSIVSFANEMIQTPPGTPLLVLAEDDFFLHSGAAIPGNAHILSTHAFLETLQELGKIPDAKSLWNEIQRQRPTVNSASVDRPAAKIKTDWQVAIDSEKAQRIAENKKPRARGRDRGPEGMSR